MTKSKNYYNPKISRESYNLLKRLAWFENKPMTKTLDGIIYQALELVSTKAVCRTCRADKSECLDCVVVKHL